MELDTKKIITGNNEDIISGCIEDLVQSLKDKGFSEREIAFGLENAMKSIGVDPFARYNERRKAVERCVQIVLEQVSSKSGKPVGICPIRAKRYSTPSPDLAASDVEFIMNSAFPMENLEMVLENKYFNIENQFLNGWAARVETLLHSNGIATTADILEELRKRVTFTCDKDFFLDQTVNISICIKDGNGNTTRPHSNENALLAEPEHFRTVIRDGNSSIVWLAKQQGYTEEDLIQLFSDSEDPESEFLVSLAVEVDNLRWNESQAKLYFLVNTTLREAIRVRKAMSEGSHGSIVLSNDTVCGLYNPSAGCGSDFGIKFADNAKLTVPFEMIQEFKPDKAMGLPICTYAGLSENAWRGKLLHINKEKSLI